MSGNVAFVGNFEDQPYVPYLKGMFNGHTAYVVTKQFKLLTELEIYCEQRQTDKIVCTQTTLLQKLIEKQGDVSNPSLDNYAGSVFTYKNIEIVFVNPLKQLFTVPHGKFICERFISKLCAREAWNEATPFRFSIPKERDIEAIFLRLSTAFAISIDTETFKNPISIRCVGYTGVFIDPSSGAITTETFVVPLNSLFWLGWVRKFNALPIRKIFQNGKYDNSYFLRYNAPVSHWFWDTAHFFHSWYSELPKDLAFLNAFFLRNVVYWKDLAETRDLAEYYRYCGLDSWATANVWIQQLRNAPDWAKHNYSLEFPLVFPCLLAEMTGLRRDQKRLVEYRAKIDGVIQRKLGELRRMVGNAEFNPNSPKQVVQLLKVLGIRDATSSGAIEINKAKFAHPLNAHILDYVSKKADDLENVDEFSIRGLRKLATTYLRTDDDAKKTGIHAGEGGAKEFYGRILYALNPHGTDTGRLASREHHFWCGIQIQNIPVGPTIKATVRAEDGFYIGECDLEQAESRDTAHISGDEKMIEAVTGPRDFHSVNASAFFGISYSDLFDDSAKKSLNKPIRNLSKRTNHGANYNMTAPVLVDTMGLKNTFEAGRLLKLPYRDPIKIGEYLLERFHETYSKLRGRKAPFEPGTYYSWVVEQVLTGKKLVSRAYHHTKFNLENYTSSEYISRGDWTRYCFGRPDKSKPDLNSYVAHPPQSLNARTLNEGYMRVFYEIALPNAEHFRLYAQIHDSILFGYKCDRADLAHKVKDCMEIPVTVRDISGNYRTFTVPAALKLGKPGANYWSECE